MVDRQKNLKIGFSKFVIILMQPLLLSLYEKYFLCLGSLNSLCYPRQPISRLLEDQLVAEIRSEYTTTYRREIYIVNGDKKSPKG